LGVEASEIEAIERRYKSDSHQPAPNQIRRSPIELHITCDHPGQFFARAHAGPWFFAGQQECRVMKLPIARITVQTAGHERRVVAGIVSLGKVVNDLLTVAGVLGTIIPPADHASLTEECRHLPEFGTLSLRKVEVHLFQVAGTVVAGDTRG